MRGGEIQGSKNWCKRGSFDGLLLWRPAFSDGLIHTWLLAGCPVLAFQRIEMPPGRAACVRLLWRSLAAIPSDAHLRENTWDMRVQVQCYSGRKADERPVRFRLEEREYLVEEILDQWYGPEEVFYKIRADDGSVYILRHQTSTPDGIWDLVSLGRL